MVRCMVLELISGLMARNSKESTSRGRKTAGEFTLGGMAKSTLALGRTVSKMAWATSRFTRNARPKKGSGRTASS
jgi:hypothetical protein